jgi:N-ethylmaleimide reductase
VGRLGSEAYTYEGLKPFVTPRALDIAEIPGIMDQYRTAAHYALTAGFDGVDIHAANVYLIDQFLRDGTNHRTDRYGGSVENRARSLFEAVEAVIGVWGPGRVGVRLSPLSAFNDMVDSNPEALFGSTGPPKRACGTLGLLALCYGSGSLDTHP